MNYNSYRDSILKKTQKRIHSVKNSLGVKDAYDFYKCNYKVKVSQLLYSKIIRDINKELGNLLLECNDIILPYYLGRITLRKYKYEIKLINGQLKNKLPIDWDTTLKLWYSDLESQKQKKLVRLNTNYVFRIYYDKSKAKYNNKAFYTFKANRNLKHLIKQAIQDKQIDALI